MEDTVHVPEIEQNDLEALERLRDARDAIVREIRKVIIGQNEIIDQLMVALLAGGHCLIIGVPGLAKTLLISTLARVLNLKFNRIQFTPDLMPSDITGTEIIEDDVSTGRKAFKFVRGPVFANIILADEINRTPPKTQSALLAGETYTLSEPFYVLATQNPIEQEGTYPLPEAQLDRFMFNIWIDYPSASEEDRIVETTTMDYSADLSQVLGAEDIVAFQRLVRRVPATDHVRQYAVKLARSTRPGNDGVPDDINKYVSWGAGPRASQYMILGAKARAALEGRKNASVEDVYEMALPVLRHRIVTNFNAEADGKDAASIVSELRKTIKE